MMPEAKRKLKWQKIKCNMKKHKKKIKLKLWETIRLSYIYEPTIRFSPIKLLPTAAICICENYLSIIQ